MFAKDCWYVAAFSAEITAKPLGRRLLDEPVVMFRTTDGRVAALEDRCCHRGLPLSMGELVGDDLRCNYHGLVFDCSGQCVRIPGQTAIPPSAKVNSYPLIEKGGTIWIWMGDPAKADAALLPPFQWREDPEWVWREGLFHFKCNYELLHDNLLDLSHLAYVHRYTIGGDPNLHFETETKVGRTERGLTLKRWMPASAAPPTYAKLVPFDGLVDRWQEVEFSPGLINLYSGAISTGRNALEGERIGGFQLRLFDAVTPETETTTHNFFASGHNFRIDESDISDTLFAELKRTVLEDIEVLDAQQLRVREGNRKLVDIKLDVAGLQARRLIQTLKAASEVPSGT
jgi:phenylpropionate dioxygenase-like ring-hydroxylating dioxygenase large terminal subunit